MRITNSAIARNYTNRLNASLGTLNKFSERAITSRRFDTFAEDTAGAVRAMKVRQSLARLENSYDNLKTAKGKISAAEDALKQTSELYQSFNERFLVGINGTTASNREDIAVELIKIRDQMVSMANSQFAETYLFGGTQGDSCPWDYQNGTLTYRGHDVMTTLNPDDPAFDQAIYDQLKEAAYVDIGLGLDFNGDAVKESSAFKITFDGMAIFGTGDDNIILQMDKMIDMLDDKPFDAAAAGIERDKLQDLNSNISAQITKIGADYNYIAFSLDRLDGERINLLERQDAIEFMDPEVAIMNMKLQEYAYNAALQMGNRILQPTVFDYLR